MMKPPQISRTILAGIAAGLTLNLAMLLTFRLLGFGWQGGGILLDPALQSRKLIEVWTRLEPLPLVVSNPAPIIFGLVLFGLGHAFIYRWPAPHWPGGIRARAWRPALLIFFLSLLFWEFFTPFSSANPCSWWACSWFFGASSPRRREWCWPRHGVRSPGRLKIKLPVAENGGCQ
jgi:hypothetical protein